MKIKLTIKTLGVFNVIFLEVDILTHRLQNNGVNVSYNHSNGDQSNDEQFEDAD